MAEWSCRKASRDLEAQHGRASVLSSNRDLTYPELEALFYSAANLANQRPLAVRAFSQEDFRSITPNDLLLGRNRLPLGTQSAFGDDDNLPRRMEVIKEMEELWWSLWIKQVFPSLVPYRRWKTSHRNPCVGDVVLVHYASKVGKGDYRLARVSEVRPDVHGIVRTVTVKMRPRDARERVLDDPPHLAPKPPVELALGVQRICVVLPVEEQGQPKDLGSEASVDSATSVQTEGQQTVSTAGPIDNAAVALGDKLITGGEEPPGTLARAPNNDTHQIRSELPTTKSLCVSTTSLGGAQCTDGTLLD